MTPRPAAPAAPAVPVSGSADLWCTYAAVRTYAWLDRLDRIGDEHRERTAGYMLACHNADGGFAWSKGMPSDAWATFYCASALGHLGTPLPDRERTARWLRSTWSGDAYAMMPGQDPEVWATHFSTRTVLDVCGEDVPDRARLAAWLGSLQTAGGGLSWSPDHARTGNADVRACYYGVAAWRALDTRERLDAPWDVPALVAWLQKQQRPGGGFAFGPDAETPCMWATYRATGALAALGAEPLEPCAGWIGQQRDASGAFVRWPGYEVADVWASFCAVGALDAVGELTGDAADRAERRLAAMALPQGGFTYREPEHAADALTTAARALTAEAGDPALPELRRWLEGCQLPNEGGVMYMPGRGAEVRCTAWALAAGAFRDDARRAERAAQADRPDQPERAERILTWLAGLQNPDGGFGYWEGRGSDLVSTAAAVEICAMLGRPAASVLRAEVLGRFTDRCERPADEGEGEPGHGNVPGAAPGLRPGLQAQRVLAAIGRDDPGAVAALLHRHRVRGGGWANQGRRMPDLLSTYEAVVTADRYRIPVDAGHLRAFLDRITVGPGVAWTPLAPSGGDPLAACLHSLLRGRLADPARELPALTLS